MHAPKITKVQGSTTWLEETLSNFQTWWKTIAVSTSSVDFSCSVVSDSLWPCELQHARLPCPSPTPGACSNSWPRDRNIVDLIQILGRKFAYMVEKNFQYATIIKSTVFPLLVLACLTGLSVSTVVLPGFLRVDLLFNHWIPFAFS